MLEENSGIWEREEAYHQKKTQSMKSELLMKTEGCEMYSCVHE